MVLMGVVIKKTTMITRSEEAFEDSSTELKGGGGAPPTPLEESWRKANKNWNVPGCKRLKEWGKWFPFLESGSKFGSSTI